MRALVLERIGEPLALRELAVPEPGPEEVLLRVSACGVCRTDLHVVDGELAVPKLPLVCGHQIIGVVESVGETVTTIGVGARVGVPWLGRTCGTCRFCRGGRENLCDAAVFTGHGRDGGFAEWAVADARFVFPIPASFADANAAPLLCAGLIGYRAYRMAGPDVETIGLYGFGAAAHVIAQLALHEGRRVFAFTRPGDEAGQAFARRLGACWVGGSNEPPPEPLDAAIVLAPVGALVPLALRSVGKGGRVVCGGIHMSDVPAFPYRILWGERSLHSVANLTRRDGEELLALAPRIPIQTEVTTYPLAAANEALTDLRSGRIEGAAVLVP